MRQRGCRLRRGSWLRLRRPAERMLPKFRVNGVSGHDVTRCGPPGRACRAQRQAQAGRGSRGGIVYLVDSGMRRRTSVDNRDVGVPCDMTPGAPQGVAGP